jgi:tripartite-type tricarboxylate transporter receptor subunit TctC
VGDVPTVAEAGVPGYEFNSWFGLVMPAGTPAPILERMHADLVAVLRDAAVRKQLHDAGADPWPGTPAEMGARIRREIELTSNLIKKAGIKL